MWFQTAAKNRDQVYNFLEDVVNNYADHGILADRVAELRSIRLGCETGRVGSDFRNFCPTR
jgi:hypothetical protein